MLINYPTVNTKGLFTVKKKINKGCGALTQKGLFTVKKTQINVVVRYQHPNKLEKTLILVLQIMISMDPCNYSPTNMLERENVLILQLSSSLRAGDYKTGD